MTDLVMNLFSPVEEPQDSTDKKPSQESEINKIAPTPSITMVMIQRKLRLSQERFLLNG